MNTILFIPVFDERLPLTHAARHDGQLDWKKLACYDPRPRLLMLQTTIDGITILVDNTRPDIDTHEAVDRLARSLDVIARYLPHRYRRLRRDFAQILIQRFPCRAAYFPDIRTCLIELTFVGLGNFTEAQIAASIVHEAVHARLDRMGVAGRPGQSAREERLCREAELELGLAVPNGEAVVERALASLGLTDEDVAPSIDWNVAAERMAAVDAQATRRGDPENR